MSKKYQWQGEPVKVTFGNCIVHENKEKPMWWHNYECRQDGMACIPAIKITTKGGYTFIIANHCGIGIHKLINGGWPSHTHFSLDGEFSTKPQLKYDTFDLEGYEKHEAERNKWQRTTFPEEYEKMKSFMSAMKARGFTINDSNL